MIALSTVVCVVIALASGCSQFKAIQSPVPVYSVDFASGAKDCKFNNYKGHTACSFVTNGPAAVVFARPEKATPKTKDTSWGLTTADFAVTPGSEYVVAMGMSGDLPPSAYIRPGANIEWLDAAGKPIMTFDALGKSVPTMLPIEFPIRKPNRGLSRAISKGVVPDGVARGRIVFGIDWPDLNDGEKVTVSEIGYYEHGRGESWGIFDDVDAPELEMLTESPTTDVHAPIRFRLTDKTGVDYSRFACTVNGRKLAAEELRRDGDEFVYTPTEPWPTGSVVRIEVDCADMNGFEATESGFVAICDTKVRHAKWTVRDDGVLLRDGEPFFPLGITNIYPADWCGEDLDRGVAEMKANGVNCAHTYMVRNRKGHPMSEHYDELVAAAEKHGIVFLPEPAFRKGNREERDALIASNLIYGRTCAAQLGWGIGDDTSRLQSPRDLKRMHRFCKAVCPDLLTISVDAVCAAPQQASYVPFADVLVLEAYPIRNEKPQDDEMALLAMTIDNGWKATKIADIPNRSVLSMPQTFKGWSRWLRYPTKDELRCEMYLSLACRARGIIAYTSYTVKGNEGAFNRPETKAEFYELTREIAALIPSLVKRDAAEQPVVTVLSGPAKDVKGGDSVRCLLKEDGLLILANSSHQPVKASIRLPSGKTIVRDLKRFAGWAERE